MGAVDVVPFIPIRGSSVEECVALSREAGAAIAKDFGVPVYLYEDSASSDLRRNLAEIRKGQFEGFAEKMKDPRWAPDFGPAEPHPSAGVVAVGARAFLIAYNINLGTRDLAIADRIAKAIRHLSGGFRYVKAMGVELADRGIVQVSINMTNFKKTPLHRVFECVRSEAERHGVADRRVRDRRPVAGRGALRGGRALPPAGGVFRGAGAGDEAAGRVSRERAVRPACGRTPGTDRPRRRRPTRPPG